MSDIYDELLRRSAERTGERFISNQEFFSSNGKGCFYEGCEYDPETGKFIIPEKEEKEDVCYWCQKPNSRCECD